MNPGRILLVAIVAIVAILVALAVARFDDGGPTRAEYETQVVSSRDALSDALAFTSLATTGPEALRRLGLTARVCRQQADELDELGAPDDLAEEADRLVVSLRFFADELDATVESLREFRRELLRQLQALNFQGYTRVQSSLRALRGEGVDVPLLGRF